MLKMHSVLFMQRTHWETPFVERIMLAFK